MKRIYSFMFAAVAAFAAASCAQELDNQVPAGETKVYTAAVDGAETKAALDGRSTNWENNDVILLYDGTAAAKYVTALESPASTANFTLVENETALAGNKVIAVYPEWADGYKSSVADIEKKALSKAYLTPNQKAKVGTYDPNAAIAMAYTEDNHLEFKNATTLLKFTVSTENVEAVTLYSIGGEKLTGEWAIDYNNGAPKATPAEGDASTDWVELSAGEDGVFEVGKDYYISVYPQTLASGFAVQFSFEGVNGKQLVKKYESPVEFKRNVILNIGNYEFTGTIVPEEPAAEWAIAGTFNEWNTKANPMALENGFYVAKNITGLNFTEQADASNKTSATGFQFINKGAWKGGEGKVTAGTWAWVWNDNGQNIYVNGAAAETAYDIYLNPTPDASGGIKFVIVAAGAAMPEDKPAEEVKVEYWAVIGTMTDNWGSEKKMTLEGDWYVVNDVKITTSDEFKFRANGKWEDTPNRGAAGDKDGVIIANNTEIDVVNNGKNFSVAESGFYSLYLNKAANKAKVVKTNDIEVEEPSDEPVASDYGLVGSFQTPTTWDVANPVVMESVSGGWIVARNVELYKNDEFKFVKNKSWTVSYGTSDVTVLEENVETTVVTSDSKNMKVSKNGKYDIYLNPSALKVKAVCVEDYANLKVNITIDNKANWSPLSISLWDGNDQIVSNATVTGNKYAISASYIGSTLTCQLSSGSKTSEKMLISISKEGATVTLEETIIKLKVQLNTANAKQWWGDTMKIHVWNTGTSFDTSWPGNTMTFEGNYTWSIIIPSELVGKTINYLVHNGNGWQSKDSKVTIKAEGNTVTGSSIGIN